MHECHVVQSIVNQALEKAVAAKATKVTKLSLGLGEMAGFDPECIRMYFEDMSKGTILEKAQLEINAVNSKLKCVGCGKIFDKVKSNFNCPHCDQLGTLAEKSKGLYIENIIIETNE